MMKMYVPMVGLLACLNTMPAYADNINVENAIKSRPDLSVFYQALVSTGVNHELNPGTSYTVFAPTNEALAQIRSEYPCFYKAECRAQAAEIVRNHIIPGKTHIADAVKHEGGFFSLGRRFVTIGEPSRDDYTVGGHAIHSMSPFSGGILYKIDDMIANPHELASLQNAQYAALPKEVTTITRKTIPDPACGPAGCPDETTETTVISRVLAEPYDTMTPLPFLP